MHLIYLRNDYLSTKKRKKCIDYLKKTAFHDIVKHPGFLFHFF